MSKRQIFLGAKYQLDMGQPVTVIPQRVLTDGIRIRLAKESALIAADEVIDTLKDEDLYIQGETNINEFIDYWQEVQEEIENL